jgi:nucleoside 2-deoxyribosyltransferase
MNIYVASHSRALALDVAYVLRRDGHKITSRWHHKPFHPTSHHTPAECEAIAQEDYDDIVAADALVLIAGPDKYSGGKFVEAGIAIGLGKRVTVIGRRENMLLWLPGIRVVESVEAFPL